MRDSSRTKADLIAEIQQLRARVAALQAGGSPVGPPQDSGLLEAVVEALPHEVYVKDAQSRFVLVNKAGERFLKSLAPEVKDVIGRTDFDFFTKEQAAGYYQEEQRMLRMGEVVASETRSRTDPDGRVRWGVVTKAPLRDPDGKPVGLLVLHHETTEQQETERFYREAEQKYQRVFAAALDAILVFRADTRQCVDANPAACDTYGYTREQLLTLRAEDLSAEPQATLLSFQRALADGADKADRRFHRSKEGTVFPVVVSVNTFTLGGQTFVCNLVRDITDLRQAEQALREQACIHQMVLETAMEGFMVARTDGTIRQANPALCSMVGYTREELEGMQIADLDVEEDCRDVERHIGELRKAGSDHFETEFRRKDGQIINVEVSCRYVELAAASHIFSFLRDITQRKRAETELQRLAHAVDHAGDGIGVLDENGCIAYANTALARILGCDKGQQLQGVPFAHLISPVADTWREVSQTLTRGGRWEGTASGNARDGMAVSLVVTLTRLEGTAEEAALTVANVRDRTTEAKYLDQIRRLSVDRDRVLENERQRISRELHDELGQLLTALAMNLAWLRRRAAAEPSFAARVDDANEIVGQTIIIVRDMVRGLRPPILDHGGLLEAMRSHLAEFRETTGIVCHLRADLGALAIPESLGTALYRILQEALTNIARHARASHCQVRLRKRGASLELQIEDNGVGAVAQSLEGQRSLGILGMRERAAAVGGRLLVRNVSSGGVRVTACVPLEESTATREGSDDQGPDSG